MAAWVMVVVGTLLFLWYFRNFLRPLVVATALLYLVSDIRNRIARKSIAGIKPSRMVAQLISLIIVFSAVYLMVDTLILSFQKLVNNFERYALNVTGWYHDLEVYAGLTELTLKERVANQKVALRNFAGTQTGTFTSLVGNFALVLFATILMLLEETFIARKLSKAFKNSSARALETYLNVDFMLASYITVTFYLSILAGVMAFIVLKVVGIEIPALWAVIISILYMIPRVGVILAPMLLLTFGFVQGAEIWQILAASASGALVLFSIHRLIEPRLMKARINVSPLVGIISLVFWTSMWGIIGALASLPLTAIIMIILSENRSTRFLAILLSKDGTLAHANYHDSRDSEEEYEGYRKLVSED